MIKERRKGVLEAGEKWVEIVRHGNNPEGDQGPAWTRGEGKKMLTTSRIDYSTGVLISP